MELKRNAANRSNVKSNTCHETRKEMFDKKRYYLNLWKKQQILLPARGRLLTFRRYVKLMSSISSPSSLILDVGSGPGVIAHMLESAGNNNLVGIDLVNRFQRGHHVTFIAAENTNLPFKNKSFDIVFARKFVSTRDMTESLQEFHRILKDNGTLIIEVPNVKRLKSRIYQSLGMTPTYPHKYFPHLHMTPFKTMLQKADYTIQNIEGDYVFIPLIGNLITLLKLNTLTRILGKSKPNLCLHLLATCKKTTKNPQHKPTKASKHNLSNDTNHIWSLIGS